MPAERTESVLRSIAANVRRLRSRRGWTQEVLAEKAGLDVRYVQRVERATLNLSVGKLVAMADALGVGPAVLMRNAVLANPKPGRPRKPRER